LIDDRPTEEKETDMSETTIDTPAGVPFIDIRREFDAPRDLVWRAWTDPELLRQWLGPARYEMIVDEYDLRDGGRWRYIHRADDGAEYGFHGVFHGEPSPDGFTQTFEYEGAPGHVSLERLTLEEHDGRTVARTHSVYQSVEARDAMVRSGMAEGVSEGFDRLDTLLAGLRPAVVH
jgi:uncharacterized protein YndB with AHSA1/START domain